MKKSIQIFAAIALLILMSASCKKSPKPEPEDLNKHLYGKVYDETDGERLSNCKIGLYQHTADGSLNISYKKIAETYSDSNGNFEFYFTKIQSSNYAIQLEKRPTNFTMEVLPTAIQPQEERKKEISFDIKVKPLGYVKWHVVGDQGNYKCFLDIGGSGRDVYKGQDEILWEPSWANRNVNVSYAILNSNSIIIKDTSYDLLLPKHDTIFVEIHF